MDRIGGIQAFVQRKASSAGAVMVPVALDFPFTEFIGILRRV
jgi:hypothetical protein